ncbi:hypothetical protein ACIRVF_42605 [Kitasatospora sp. NPDC101157]|uniref:hypothetical protein n=1 Tax=Kitasatospora sp. NPDC101157 TaxID=3364098 RepID=UPI00380CC843
MVLEHTHLAKEQPANASTPQLAKVADARAAALAVSMHGIERRVTAIEEYARHVAEVEGRYAEWCRAQQLTHGTQDVLALLARTAADDLAVAELEGLTAEAALVAQALCASVESARKAGDRALPLPAQAAGRGQP